MFIRSTILSYGFFINELTEHSGTLLAVYTLRAKKPTYRVDVAVLFWQEIIH